MTKPSEIVLEPALTRYFAGLPSVDYTQFEPAELRALLAATFKIPEDNFPVHEEEFEIETRAGGLLALTVTRPLGTEDDSTLPVLIYLHGGGWVVGDKNIYSSLRRELTVRAHAVVVFVNYSLAPEARFPVAVEECYDALTWLLTKPGSLKADTSRIAVVGDSAGGNLAIALSILAKQRGLEDPICLQVFLYPCVGADFETESYKIYGNMNSMSSDFTKWFWKYYCNDEEDKKNILMCPIESTTEDLRDLPPALMITCEADVLRDEAEAFARKLMAADVPVVASRYLGAIHGICSIACPSNSREAILEQVLSELRKAYAKKC